MSVFLAPLLTLHKCAAVRTPCTSTC